MNGAGLKNDGTVEVWGINYEHQAEVPEGLSNVVRHAHASEVLVTFALHEGVLEIVVSDNGQGFEVSRALAKAAQRGRLGLVGIGAAGTISIRSGRTPDPASRATTARATAG